MAGNSNCSLTRVTRRNRVNKRRHLKPKTKPRVPYPYSFLTMDAFNVLKLCTLVSTAVSPSITSLSTYPRLVLDSDNEEDSYFDLKLSISGFDNKENRNINNTATPVTKFSNFDREYMEPALGLSSVVLLKPTQSFRVLMFKKPKVVVAAKKTVSKKEKQKQQCKKESKILAVKLKIEEFRNNSPFLSRASSTKSMGSNHAQPQCSEGSKPERVSKDVIRKYLKLIKPLYVKVRKRYSDKSIRLSQAFSSASPKKEKQKHAPSGNRVLSKHLGKSKSASASASTGVASPVNRRDDSLLEQHDGIQGAILHCKKSFKSSRDSHWSFASDPFPQDSTRNSFEVGDWVAIRSSNS